LASEASKKYERSEFIVAFDFAFAFLQIHASMNQKNCPSNRAKRDSIEFEQSENQGQFFISMAFNYFLKFLNTFTLAESLYLKGFPRLYSNVSSVI